LGTVSNVWQRRFWRHGARRAGVVIALLVLVAAGSTGAPASDSLTYVAREGDTLIGMGKRLLIDPTAWPQVQALNNLQNPRAIPVGTRIRIPRALLKSVPQQVRVLAAEGDVTVTGMRLQPGQVIVPGSEIRTGEPGSATVQLADGSTLTLQAGSRATLERAEHYDTLSVFDSVLRLLFGRVETRVSPRSNGGRFEVHTPVANMGVRGTQFRVAADASGRVASAEVLEGQVAAQSAVVPLEVAVPAGFGTRVEAGKAADPPVPLLPAPNVAQLPGLQERVTLRFQLPADGGVSRYRAQVAVDRDFQRVVSDAVFNTPDIKFAGLMDGNYFLRVRGIDGQGLEGRDAVHPFTLKARPEPPFPSAPSARGKVAAGTVRFAWSDAVEASTYRLQVASDAGFSTLVTDAADIKGTEQSIALSTPGTYHWRVASARANGEAGPFGDPLMLDVRPQTAPLAAPIDSAHHWTFTLPVDAGQRLDFQVARDPAFKDVLATPSFESGEVAIAKPEPGDYFIRYRPRDPDGFTGSYSAAQKVSVPTQRPWYLMLFLLPLLF
jgi:hypothetical protein